MRVIIIDDSVEINGRKYVPDDGICRLGIEHFAIARELPDGWDCILWALENQENVAGMLAWHRAPKDEPKVTKPVAVKSEKVVKTLF